MRVFGFLLKEPLIWFYILCFCKKQSGEAFKYEKNTAIMKITNLIVMSGTVLAISQFFYFVHFVRGSVLGWRGGVVYWGVWAGDDASESIYETRKVLRSNFCILFEAAPGPIVSDPYIFMI